MLQVIEQLSERIIYSNELTDKQKALIADTLGVRINKIIYKINVIYTCFLFIIFFICRNVIIDC